MQSITYIFEVSAVYLSVHIAGFFRSCKASNFIGIALWRGCSPVNLLYIFRTPFPKNTSRWVLLIFISFRWLLSSPRWKIYFQVSHQKSFENLTFSPISCTVLTGVQPRPRLPLLAKWCARTKVAPWDMVFLDFCLGYYTKKLSFPRRISSVYASQNRSFLRIWSHLQKKSFMGNFIFCAAYYSGSLSQKLVEA